MSSPGQKRGSCGHAMPSFDGHAFCARCRDKGKGKDPCMESPNTECKFCSVLTPEQHAQLATPSYKLKKEKHEAKNLHPVKTLLGWIRPPFLLLGQLVIQALCLHLLLPFLKRRSRRKSPLHPKLRNLTVCVPRFKELDKKWSDYFIRLQALFMAKSLQRTFYCVNTSYPMDNSLSGRRRPARQTPEKDVLCFH